MRSINLIQKMLYVLRYFLYVKLNHRIKYSSIVLIQKNVKLIVENGGEIVFGKHVVIKEGTVIYAKKDAKIIIGNNTSTGHNTEISANNYINIGYDVIMGAYTYITDSNHSYKDKNIPIRKQPMNSGKTTVGNNVWLGRNVMILKNANIGNNSVVGGGSVVTKKFENNLILGGVPAKVIRENK